jgi:enamine deaminase RidA (YjgF/YER057c/UK114 family)
VAGDQVFVSGMLGARPGAWNSCRAGSRPRRPRRWANIETILAAGGGRLADVAKVNVYLTDMARFGAMNDAYLAVFGTEPAARITVGCTGLALGALVKMDCVAFRPDDVPDLGDMP